MYLYSQNGNLIKEFNSQIECAKYINYDAGELTRAIKASRLIKKKYFVSKIPNDSFKKQKRENYIDKTFYIYKSDGSFVGKFIGKEMGKVIGLESWDLVNRLFTHKRNWNGDYYVSLVPLDVVPPKPIGNGICVDVFTKDGIFVERLNTINDVVAKYDIPIRRLKSIKKYDKKFNNYIFKYGK